MTDQQDPRHEQYDRVRDAFEDLKIEDKTVFLIKETVNTIVQGVEEAARTIIEEFDSMFGGEPAEEAAAEEKTAENGAAKTSTSRKKTTASKAKSTTAKKTTAKKTTTRKTTTRKTTAKKTTPKKDDSDAS